MKYFKMFFSTFPPNVTQPSEELEELVHFFIWRTFTWIDSTISGSRNTEICTTV